MPTRATNTTATTLEADKAVMTRAVVFTLKLLMTTTSTAKEMVEAMIRIMDTIQRRQFKHRDSAL